MTTTSVPSNAIVLTDGWQLDISLQALTLSNPKQESYTYPLRSITALAPSSTNPTQLQLEVQPPKSAVTTTYLLCGLSAHELKQVTELYVRYTGILVRLRALVIAITNWHREVVGKLEQEFQFKGYITLPWVKDQLKKLVAKRPTDKHNLLSDPNIIELLHRTMTAQSLLPVMDYQLEAEELAQKFNETKVQGIVERNPIFFQQIEKSPLTQEQINAVTNLNDRVLLNAAAGSGKTSTMVARMGYLCAFGFQEQKYILALAYNTKAVRELQARTTSRLNNLGINCQPLLFKTFHALGLDIIRQITGRTPLLAPGIDNEDNGLEQFTRFIQQLYLKKATFRLLLATFSEAFASSAARCRSTSSRQEYLTSTAVHLLSLAGIDVATHEDGHNQNRYLSLAGHVEVILHPEKEKPTNAQRGYQLAGTVSYLELFQGSGYLKLLKIIRNHYSKIGFATEVQYLKPLAAINARALELGKKPKFWRLASLLKAFLTHSKNSLKDQEYLQQLLFTPKTTKYSIRERLFFLVFKQASTAWRNYLGQAIDYEDMLNEASRLIEEHQWTLPLSHILIDECQDFSGARARLIQNLVKYCGARIFAVGDDWQNINRFSGSELSVMTEFKKYFGVHDTLRLECTFRCSQGLCDIASNFVAQNPRQLRKKVYSVHETKERPIAIYEQENELELKYAIKFRAQELIKSNQGQNISILLLGRYKSDITYAEYIFQDPALAPFCTFMTVHSSKGLEADYVILVRATDELLGFPSQITDDDLLGLVEPSPEDFPYAEERRLFYVALTRARRHTSIFTIIKRNSLFVSELLSYKQFNLKKEHMPIPPGLIPPEILCRHEDCHGYYIKRNGRNGTFWGCSNYPECTSVLKSLKTLSDKKNPLFLKKKKFSYY